MQLDQATEIATAAHEGQRDRAGNPYILHPLRVMAACSVQSHQIVAVLHDVIEKSDWTLEALRAEGLPDELAQALDAVTRRDGEDYFDFVRRAGRNEIARAVKIADLRDNLMISRLTQPQGADPAQADRYRRALQILDAAPD